MNIGRLPIPLVHGVRRGAGVKRRSDGKTLLQDAREWIVRRYRQSPNLWPDGIDSKWVRWYRPEEWTDEGEYLGPQAVDKPVDKPALSTAKSNNVVDRKAYQREWTKRKRAAAKELSR